MASDKISDPDTALTAVRQLRSKDLGLLRCPVCRSQLELVSPSPLPALEVRCTECGRGYPIVDGIAVLLAQRSLRYI